MKQRYILDECWIAVPSATPSQVEGFLSACKAAGLNCKMLPSLPQSIEARNYSSYVREIRLEDLLPRTPVTLATEPVADRIRGCSVMVTGAAGSIGSELCSQVLDHNPKRLICVDQNETGIFYLELKHKQHRNTLRATYCVADVANSERMQSLLERYHVNVIFHAAAYKHVPVMEANVREAVENNVQALVRLLNSAEAAGTQSFVLVSSDKAVNPTNVMGATKRIGELIMASRPKSRMECVAVRFGNVLGSAGSIVPILTEQIRSNSALTITHPEIRRFFMTIPEAVALVLQAFSIGKHGEILVLDMGKSVPIIELARKLIRLHGKSETEVPIKFTGLREGEKLDEELFYSSEEVLDTMYEAIKSTRANILQWRELQAMLEELALVCSSDDDTLIRLQLQNIVPEFSGCRVTPPATTDFSTAQR